jgi:hypothetical protein
LVAKDDLNVRKLCQIKKLRVLLLKKDISRGICPAQAIPTANTKPLKILGLSWTRLSYQFENKDESEGLNFENCGNFV